MLGGLLEGLLGSFVRLGVGTVEPPLPWRPGDAGVVDPGVVEGSSTRPSSVLMCLAALAPGFFKAIIMGFTAALSAASSGPLRVLSSFSAT